MLCIMIIGGDVHKFPGEYMTRVDGAFLIIHNHRDQTVATYAAHRTVRSWYEDHEPEIVKAV